MSQFRFVNRQSLYLRPDPARVVVTGGRMALAGDDGTGETIYFVKDNGVGAETESIGYDPLEGSPRSPGVDELPVMTGGLAVAKRIIGSHHGRLWREAEGDAGTTLFFSLPSKDRRR